MGLEFIVLSDRKGSNPGGRCIYGDSDEGQIFYVKYCPCTRIRAGESSFVPDNQPVYEGITLEMAKRIGLNIPNYYIHFGKKTNFIAEKGIKSDIKNGKKFYFLSDLIDTFMDNKQEELIKNILENESIYRDLLQVSDIVGRAQNYCFKRGKIFYLDLGCAFVDAHESKLGFKKSHHPKLLEKKEFKRFMKKISKYYMKLNNKDEVIKLDDFVNLPYNLKMSIMDESGRKDYKKLNEIITEKEINEIVQRLAAGIKRSKVLGKNDNSSTLIYE